ncbi:MAG: YfhO family protein, partial [Bacteroidota bacterium]
MSKPSNKSKRSKTTKAPPKKGTKPQLPFLDQLTAKQLHLLGIGVFALLGLIVFWLYLSGQFFYLFKDTGSDTVNLYWPNFVNTADYFRQYGWPTWSFQQGMGQNILPYSIGDPFNWIMYFMGADRLHAGIAWAEYFKVIAAGSFFLAFLRNLGVKNLTALIGGILYAFSGFMILGGTWYIFSSEAVFFALLLWSFELLYQKKQVLLFPIAVCLLGAYNPFDWFTYGLILLFYAGMRHFAAAKKPAEFGQLIGQLVLYGALGVGLSAFLSVSGIMQILNSPRVEGDSRFFSTLAGTGLFSLE